MDWVGRNQPAAPEVSAPFPVSVSMLFQTGTSVCVPEGQPLGFGDTAQ
jgi:hypothetical protein